VGIDAKMPFDLLGVVVGIEPLVMLVVLTFGSGTTVVLELCDFELFLAAITPPIAPPMIPPMTRIIDMTINQNSL
jgi:hypothetical protein